jgi:hypothetical protein
MLKMIGILAILGALAVGFAMLHGSMEVDATVTDKGKQEISKARNSMADALRDGVDSVSDRVADE